MTNNTTLNIEIEHIEFNQIIFFNSANYVYLEMFLNQNAIVEGGNNVGKTSILNALQFLLLPEDNLNKISSKFSLTAGKDFKEFSAEETYNYYFSDENSYVIFEVSNFYHTFCVILYGHTKHNFEYRRMIVPCEFKDIKPFLLNENKEQKNIARKDFFAAINNQLQDNKKIIELKTKEDIKNYLYAYNDKGNKARNIYNIVPLQKIDNNNVDNFKVLFKSLYNIFSMKKEQKIKLVADIIKSSDSHNKKNKQSIETFNISELDKNFKDLKIQQHYLENLNSMEEKFIEIQDFFENHISIKHRIKKETVELWVYLRQEIESVNELTTTYKKDMEELDRTIKEETIKKNQLQSFLSTQNNTFIEKNKEKKDFDTILNNLITFFKISSTNIITNKETLLIELKNNLNEVEQEIITFKQTQNNLKGLESNKEQLYKNRKKILELEKEIENIIQNFEKQQHWLINQDSFTEEEKIKLSNILINNFLTFTIPTHNTDVGFESIQKFIEDIKTFLKHFEIINNELICYGKKIISRLNFKEDISNYQLKFDLNNNNNNIQDNKRLINDLERENRAINNIIENINQEENLEPSKQTNYSISHLQKLENKKIELEDLKYHLSKIEFYIEKTKELEIVISQYTSDINNKKITLDTLTEYIINQETLKREKQETNRDLWAESERMKKIQKELEGHVIQNHNSFYGVFSIEELLEEFKHKTHELDTNKKEYQSTLLEISNKITTYNINENEIFNVLNECNRKNIFKDKFLDEELNTNFKQNWDVIEKLINFLSIEYANINELNDKISNDIKAFCNDTNNALSLLKETKNDIKSFERTINEAFSKIQVSNLKGIQFEFQLNKQLLDIIEDFKENISEQNLNFEKNILQINDYISKHSTGYKNEINIESLITDIKYKVLHSDNTSYIEVAQSHGTETMIMLIFIITLFKGIYAEGTSLKLPIIVDEIAKIDFQNVEGLIKIINDHNYVLFGATPEAGPDLRTKIEHIVIVDGEMSSKTINKNRKWFREHDSFYNLINETKEV